MPSKLDSSVTIVEHPTSGICLISSTAVYLISTLSTGSGVLVSNAGTSSYSITNFGDTLRDKTVTCNNGCDTPSCRHVATSNYALTVRGAVVGRAPSIGRGLRGLKLIILARRSSDRPRTLKHIR